MGYSHYWSYDPTHPDWQPGCARLVLDAKRIIQAAGVPLWRELDEPGTTPELAEGWVRFNGTGDAGHLASYRRRGFWWSFCKTARKPYDLVVCAILLRAHQHMPTCVAIGSDGSWEAEWQFGATSWPGAPQTNRGRGARLLVAELFGADQVPGDDALGSTVDGPPSVRRRPPIR